MAAPAFSTSRRQQLTAASKAISSTSYHDIDHSRKTTKNASSGKNNSSSINIETVSTTKKHEARNAARRPTCRSSLQQEAIFVNLGESVKSGEVETDNSSGRQSDTKTAVSRTERNRNVHGSMHLQDGPSPTNNGARASRPRTEAQPQTPTRTCQAPSPQRTRHYGSSTTTTTPSSHHHSLPSLQLCHHLTTTTYPAKRRNGQQR